jgi:hypothetical protein
MRTRGAGEVVVRASRAVVRAAAPEPRIMMSQVWWRGSVVGGDVVIVGGKVGWRLGDPGRDFV